MQQAKVAVQQRLAAQRMHLRPEQAAQVPPPLPLQVSSVPRVARSPNAIAATAQTACAARQHARANASGATPREGASSSMARSIPKRVLRIAIRVCAGYVCFPTAIPANRGSNAPARIVSVESRQLRPSERRWESAAPRTLSAPYAIAASMEKTALRLAAHNAARIRSASRVRAPHGEAHPSTCKDGN